jgi:hypothetical protein
VGDTPAGLRRIGAVCGRVFEGDGLSGVVLNGGSDWQTVRSDGSTTLDVRLVLKTEDGALIAMSYRGIRSGPADALAHVDSGEDVDPSTYYFRIAPVFETSALSTPGSITSSLLASATARPKRLFTAFMPFFEQQRCGSLVGRP